MRRKNIFLILFLFSVMNIFAHKYSISNLFEIDIPEDLEIVKINQSLQVQNDNSQYYISSNLFIIYQNKYFTMSILCYGNKNESILKGDETLNMEKYTYYGSYGIADRIKYLKRNYSNMPFFNKNNIKMSKLVSDWPSGVTSDTYGLYFTLLNSDFNECSIIIDNIWGAFAQNEKLVWDDNNYKNKIKNEGGKLEELFQKLEFIENSITYTISNSSNKINNGYTYQKYPADYSYILPTINNLRMRNSPALTGEFSGFMKNSIYMIIRIGENVEIDGISGNWIMIKPAGGNSLSWVFSGYTRKATEQEIEYFSERT